MDITERITTALVPARKRGDRLTVTEHEDGAVTVEWSGPRIRQRPTGRTLIQRTEGHARKFAAAARAALAAEGLEADHVSADSAENYGDRVRFGRVEIETGPATGVTTAEEAERMFRAMGVRIVDSDEIAVV